MTPTSPERKPLLFHRTGRIFLRPTGFSRHDTAENVSESPKNKGGGV